MSSPKGFPVILYRISHYVQKMICMNLIERKYLDRLLTGFYIYWHCCGQETQKTDLENEGTWKASTFLTSSSSLHDCPSMLTDNIFQAVRGDIINSIGKVAGGPGTNQRSDDVIYCSQQYCMWLPSENGRIFVSGMLKRKPIGQQGGQKKEARAGPKSYDVCDCIPSVVSPYSMMSQSLLLLLSSLLTLEFSSLAISSSNPGSRMRRMSYEGNRQIGMGTAATPNLPPEANHLAWLDLDLHLACLDMGVAA